MLELVVDEDELVRRLSGRRMLVDGQMVQRDDDKPETVRHRLEVYREQTAPLSGFYESEGLLSRIDAIGEVEEVTGRRHGGAGRRRDPGSRRSRAADLEGRAATMTRGILLARLPLLAKWSGRMIQIKTPHEIELMRASGLVTAGAHRGREGRRPPGCQHR